MKCGHNVVYFVEHKRMEGTMKLTQKRIGALPAGRHGDSGYKTLFVVVQPSGSRAFVQRLTVNGRRADRGAREASHVDGRLGRVTSSSRSSDASRLGLLQASRGIR